MSHCTPYREVDPTMYLVVLGTNHELFTDESFRIDQPINMEIAGAVQCINLDYLVVCLFLGSAPTATTSNGQTELEPPQIDADTVRDWRQQTRSDHRQPDQT